jgi:hypothetical protein
MGIATSQSQEKRVKESIAAERCASPIRRSARWTPRMRRTSTRRSGRRPETAWSRSPTTPGSRSSCPASACYWCATGASTSGRAPPSLTDTPTGSTSRCNPTRVRGSERCSVAPLTSHSRSGRPSWRGPHPARLTAAQTCAAAHELLQLRRPPFNDVRARQAVNLALDRAAIARRFGGPFISTPTR